MKLDNQTLTMLLIQTTALSLIGVVPILFRTTAKVRVWCIRLSLVAVLVLSALSQFPVSRALPAQRPIMLPMPQYSSVAVSHQSAAAPTPGHQLPGHQAITWTIAEVWTLGSIAGLIWILIASARLRRIRARSLPHSDVRGIQTRTATGFGSPFVAGFVTPVLYLPENSLQELSGEQLASIFAHELAHVQHNDVRWKALHRITCVLLWPNPLIWLLCAPHDRAMEELADATATLSAESPSSYAAVLLAVAESRKTSDPALALAMARKRSNIGRRIVKVLRGDAAKELTPLRRRTRLGTLCLTLISLVAVLAGLGWRKPIQNGSSQTWQTPSGLIDFRIVAPGGGLLKDPRAWVQIWLADGQGTRCDEVSVKGDLVRLDLSKFSAADGLRLIARDAAGNIGCAFPSPGSNRTDLVLVPTCKVSGTFVRPDGSPEAGVQVVAVISVMDPGPDRFGAIQLKDTPFQSATTTDSKGEFVLAGVPKNGVLQMSLADPSVQQPLRAIRKGNSTSFGLQVGGGDTNDLGQIELKLAGQVSGRMTVNGRGVPGIRIGAQAVNDDINGSSLASWGEAVTDANGDYVIGGLGDLKYDIAPFLPAALAEQYACAAKDSVAVVSGKTLANQDFQLDPGGIIEGEVVLKSNSNPVGYPVAYYGPDHPRSGARCGYTRCDSKGHFKLRVSPGKQFVYLQASQPTEGQDVDVKAGETVHLTLKE